MNILKKEKPRNRKMRGISNTQRTLRALRQEGCICDIVERFISQAGKFGKRLDCFGFIDIIAIKSNGICAIQSCGQSFSEHHQKILENENAPEWLKAGGQIELWGWRKIKKHRGGKQMVWMPRVYVYKMEDFE